jgi:hypothetical protein
LVNGIYETNPPYNLASYNESVIYLIKNSSKQEFYKNLAKFIIRHRSTCILYCINFHRTVCCINVAGWNIRLNVNCGKIGLHVYSCTFLVNGDIFPGKLLD